MSRGNEIIVSANPRGVFMEGFVGVGVTVLPGQVMQLDATVAVQGGRHTFKLYSPGTNGKRPVGPIYIVRANDLLGKDNTVAYAAGDRVYLYTPIAGEEFNMVVADVAGTADSHAAGENLMLQTGTGKLLATTGTPESNPFLLLEAITQPAGDTLAWCMYSGY